MDDSGRSRAEQAGVLMFGKIVSTIGEALGPIILIRLMSKTDVGLLSAVMLIYTTLALVLTSAFPATLMYFLPTRDVGERRAVTVRVSWLMTGLGALLAAILLALGLTGLALEGSPTTSIGDERSLFDPTTLSYLLALAPYPLGDLPSRLLPNLLVVEGRARAAATVGVLKAIGSAVATLLPVALGLPLHVILGCASLFGLLNGLWLAYYIVILYRGAPRVAAPITAREIVRFAIPLGLTDMMGRLNSELDRTLIAGSFPVARFAEYRAAAWQVPIIKEVPYTVGRVDTPYLTRLFEEGKPLEAMALWRASIEKVSLLVMPLACIFIVGAEEVVTLLFTADYIGAAPVFRMYSFLMLGRVSSFGNVIVAAGKPRYVFQAALFSFLSNLIISIPALWVFGFIGPAIGTVVSFIPMTYFYCWCIAKAANVPMRETFPLLAYMRLLLTVAVACVPAVLLKLYAGWGPAASLAAISLSLLATFGLVGSLTRQIHGDDWRFLARWLRGGFAGT